MDKEENVSKCLSVLDALHWIDTAILEVVLLPKKSTSKNVEFKGVDETSTSNDEDNVVLNDLVARIRGHNDLLLQSFDDFVACDTDVETCDNTITNLKIKCWRNTLSCKIRFQLKVIMKTNCLKKMKQVVLLTNAANLLRHQ